MPQKTDHDMLVELHQAVCGIDGQNGLLREVKALKADHYKLKENFWKFFWISIGVLGVSGASVGGVKLFELLLKGGAG